MFHPLVLLFKHGLKPLLVTYNPLATPRPSPHCENLGKIRDFMFIQFFMRVQVSLSSSNVPDSAMTTTFGKCKLPRSNLPFLGNLTNRLSFSKLEHNSLTLLGHDQSSSSPFWRSTTPSCLPKTGETPLSMSAWRKSSPVSHLSTTPQREHWHWPPPSTARSPDMRNPSRTWCWLSQPTERSMDTRLRRIWRALFEFACVIIHLLILCFTFQQKKFAYWFCNFHNVGVANWLWVTNRDLKPSLNINTSGCNISLPSVLTFYDRYFGSYEKMGVARAWQTVTL